MRNFDSVLTAVARRVVIVALFTTMAGCDVLSGRGTAEVAVPRQEQELGQILAIATGAKHSCQLVFGGKIWCQGENSSGQLGSGTFESSIVMIQVWNVDNAVAVTVGFAHACAVLSDGQAKCWGNNENGQLGDGTQANSPLPVRVKGIDTAIAIASKWAHTCVLLSSGQVSCWGIREGGVLGDGATDGVPGVPTMVEGIMEAASVATGISQSYAVLSDGTVWKWGTYRFGSGMTDLALTPVQIPEINDAKAVAAGRNHACALLRNGKVKCWGSSIFGQTGQEPRAGAEWPFVERHPVLVEGLSRVRSIAAGAFHTCALLQEGAVKCWGVNGGPQVMALGNRGFSGQASFRPVTVDDVKGARSISIALLRSCALVARDFVRCWGVSGVGGTGTDGGLN